MVYFVPICTLLGKNDNKCPFTMSYWCLIYCFQISSNNLIMVKLTYISTYTIYIIILYSLYEVIYNYIEILMEYLFF